MKPTNQALSILSVVPVLPAAGRPPLRMAYFPVPLDDRTEVSVVAVWSAALACITWVQSAGGTGRLLPS